MQKIQGVKVYKNIKNVGKICVGCFNCTTQKEIDERVKTIDAFSQSCEFVIF